MKVLEDVEHCRALVEFRFPALRVKAFQDVASGWLAETAGAQEPQCTCEYMRIPSTTGLRQAPAQ